MSQHVLPLLFLNMGGEMNYILDQRLQAQNIGPEKSTKVRADILHAMFNKKFLEELFKPQDMYSRRSMRAFFEKLAHASIMRLNENSMDKLYDLMTMGVKYQVHLCVGAEQILLITLNHLDGVRQLLPNDREISDKIDYAHQLLMEHFGPKPLWEWALIRATMLNFFQDARVKVSILMREKKQLEDGRFVLDLGAEIRLPFNGHVPGTVRYFDEGDLTKTDNFPVPGNFINTTSKGNTECRSEDRGTELGLNMYKLDADSAQIQGAGGVSRAPHEAPPGGDEMKLLSRLIARSINDKGEEGDGKKGGELDLSLFDDANEERVFQEETEKAINVLRIDATKAKSSLSNKIKEMKLDDGSEKKKKTKGEDMLELFDEAATRPATSKQQRERSRSASGKTAAPALRSNSAAKRAAGGDAAANKHSGSDSGGEKLQRGNSAKRPQRDDSAKGRKAADAAAKPTMLTRAESATAKRPTSTANTRK